jgi:hypothetical protein
VYRAGRRHFETISANAGCDWKFAPTHARFTSNPGEYIAGFRPGGLKRLEMLLQSVVWGQEIDSETKDHDQLVVQGSEMANSIKKEKEKKKRK